MDGKSNPPQLEALSYPWNVPVIVIYSLTAFVSLCSNLITVVILLKGEHLSTELWKFLLNLCIADIIMSIFCTEVSVCASVWPSFSHFSSLLCVISSFNQRLSILTGFYLPFFPFSSCTALDLAVYLHFIYAGSLDLSAVELCTYQLHSMHFSDGKLTSKGCCCTNTAHRP